MYKILVIDDEPAICKALVMGLASADMEVHSTADGGSGVARGCAGSYDVFIVDLYLPDMNGLDVIRKIKKCTADSVYILITAQCNLDNARDAARIGVKGFLEKPLHMNAVLNVVRNGLASRQKSPRRD